MQCSTLRLPPPRRVPQVGRPQTQIGSTRQENDETTVQKRLQFINLIFSIENSVPLAIRLYTVRFK